MKRLTEEDIEKINKIVDNWEEGIFRESLYVPTTNKNLCCVLRWNSEGRGGSCWDDENTINEIYYNDEPEFTALHLALSHIGVQDPEQIKYIDTQLVNEVDDAGSDVGWYGDYDDYKAKWVDLEEIYKYLGI